MKKIFFIFLCIVSLLNGFASAEEKTPAVNLNSTVQEAEAAALGDDENEKPKKKKQAKKLKKSHKAKKVSSNN